MSAATRAVSVMPLMDGAWVQKADAHETSALHDLDPTGIDVKEISTVAVRLQSMIAWEGGTPSSAS